ncbi:MAG: prolyl oligopeptidase family serine peptidase, partial [Xanthomonadales bacterium]|nr:prolyl oligopeptidase family serine peptidase [Xanthomonadales bacterium]
MASMTRRVVYVLVCVTGFFTIPAVAKAPGVEVFARHNKVQNVQISPDGKHIAFNFEAENNEVKLAIASSDLSRIVHVLGYGKNHHLGNHFWVSNTRILSWEWRNTGNLDGRRQFRQLIGLDFDGENREILFVPERSSIEIYSRFRADPEHIIVGKRHWRDEGQVSLYKLNVMDGELDFLGGLPFASAESRIVDMAVDLGGELRLAIENYEGEDEYDPDDDTSYVHYKSRSGDWKRLDVKSARSRPKFLNLGFDGSNRILYFLSDYDVPRNDPSVRGTLGVFSFNFDTEKVNLVFRHPDVDIERGLYGPQGEVLGVRYEPGYPQHHYFDSEDADTKLWLAMEATFPGQQVTISNYTWDEERAVVHVYSDKNPGTYYLFGDGKLRHIADVQPEIDPDWLGSQEAFTMSARDGVKLYGFLTLPPGNNDKNLPMVVNPHGGPHGPYDEWGYDRDVQMLAAHGYAVLQVNFRGSGGYGDDFERSGWRQWGRKMQDDVT